MFLPANIWRRLKSLQSSKSPQFLDQWPGPGKSPYSPYDIACHGKVITWKTYLAQRTRAALLDLHALERLEEGYEAFWKWETTQPILERLRISHFEWTYISYTVPDSPTFQVWLPGEEIKNGVFPCPVPPFTAIEYERTRRAAVPDWTSDSREIASLMFEEESILRASARLWKPEHFAATQFYRTLPYNPVEQQRRGRQVQTHY